MSKTKLLISFSNTCFGRSFQMLKPKYQLSSTLCLSSQFYSIHQHILLALLSNHIQIPIIKYWRKKYSESGLPLRIIPVTIMVNQPMSLSWIITRTTDLVFLLLSLPLRYLCEIMLLPYRKNSPIASQLMQSKIHRFYNLFMTISNVISKSYSRSFHSSHTALFSVPGTCLPPSPSFKCHLYQQCFL